jgi:hypothetical protein
MKYVTVAYFNIYIWIFLDGPSYIQLQAETRSQPIQNMEHER